jgi:hypothetical protein
MDKRALVPSVILAVSIMVLFSAAAFSDDWFMDYNASELHEQRYTVPSGLPDSAPQWPTYGGVPIPEDPDEWEGVLLPEGPDGKPVEPDKETDPAAWDQWKAWMTWDDWRHSINYQLFEEFGPILLVLALLMFGSIIGGVYIAKEDDATEEEETE